MSVKCIKAPDCVVEVLGDRIIIATWAWTIEIDVEKVKDIKALSGKPVIWNRQCITEVG